MSELESLATVEPLAARLHRHRFDRLVMLCDGIFAISATLAALEIRLPDRAPDLLAIFAEAGRDIAIYLLSFVIIGALWFSNRELFARLKRVDVPVTVLTLGLLCLTGLIPAVTHRMHGRPDGDFAAYMLVMGVAGGFNAALWTYTAARPGIMLDEIGRGERWRRALVTLVLPVLTTSFLVLPLDTAPLLMLPLLVVLVALRRLVLPRLFPDAPALPNQRAAP